MKVVKQLMIPGLALLLTACGGGETGTGATAGRDVSVGAITAFGSVWVNGVRFDTSGTVIEREGMSVTQDALGLGMVVEVRGRINADGSSGVADSIIAEDVLRGPVDMVQDQSSLMVLGQEVQVSPLTELENFSTATILELAGGDLVEVSGYVRQEGVIAATRIRRITIATQYRLTGYVTGFDADGKRFHIGQTSISYDGADMSGMHDRQPDAVHMVRVRGIIEAGTGTFVAASVEAADILEEDADHLQLEGYVSSFTSQSDFAVNGVTVRTSVQTRYQGGVAADVSVGRKLEVEGSLSKGILYASLIEFEEAIALEAMLASVDAPGGTLTLRGLEALTVTVDGNTEMNGIFGLGQLTTEYYISLRGIRAADGSVVATLIEAAPESSTLVVMQGPLQGFDAVTGVVTVLDQDIDTLAWPDENFVSDHGPGGRQGFFETARAGLLVEFEGQYNNIDAVVDWQMLEYE